MKVITPKKLPSYFKSNLLKKETIIIFFCLLVASFSHKNNIANDIDYTLETATIQSGLNPNILNATYVEVSNSDNNISFPTTQAHSIVFQNVHAAKLSLSWTRGNGGYCAVFMTSSVIGSAVPVDDVSYTANSIFKAGDQIGSSGWFCIYNGIGTTANVNGIMPNSIYRLMVCEYNENSGFIRYNTTTATDNPANQETKDIVINETDADTPSTDILEFIELYDGGVGNVSLDNLAIIFFNGSDDQSYNISPHANGIDLDGYSTDANGYFVLGNSGVSAANLNFNNNSFQNGADAVALYLGNGTDFPNDTPISSVNLIDAVVYDTNDADNTGLLALLTGG